MGGRDGGWVWCWKVLDNWVFYLLNIVCEGCEYRISVREYLHGRADTVVIIFFGVCPNCVAPLLCCPLIGLPPNLQYPHLRHPLPSVFLSLSVPLNFLISLSTFHTVVSPVRHTHSHGCNPMTQPYDTTLLHSHTLTLSFAPSHTLSHPLTLSHTLSHSHSHCPRSDG